MGGREVPVELDWGAAALAVSASVEEAASELLVHLGEAKLRRMLGRVRLGRGRSGTATPAVLGLCALRPPSLGAGGLRLGHRQLRGHLQPHGSRGGVSAFGAQHCGRRVGARTGGATAGALECPGRATERCTSFENAPMLWPYE